MPTCPRSDSPLLSSPSGCASLTAPTALADADIRNFAPVARIMKTALPENAKIAKEAKECMQECVSEFISFITSEGTLFTFSRFSSFCCIHISREEMFHWAGAFHVLHKNALPCTRIIVTQERIYIIWSDESANFPATWAL